MVFNDLREFIAACEQRKDVKVIEEADWNLEIGLITEWQISEPNNPLLLFKNIKGYPPLRSPYFALAHNLRRSASACRHALSISCRLS